jgi:hypothetical protein
MIRARPAAMVALALAVIAAGAGAVSGPTSSETGKARLTCISPGRMRSGLPGDTPGQNRFVGYDAGRELHRLDLDSGSSDRRRRRAL